MLFTTTITLFLAALVGAQKNDSATTSATESSNSTASASSTSSGEVPTSTSGISTCTLACVSAAAQLDGCESFANISCVCSSAQFQVDAAACLNAHCSKTDVAAALALQNTTCSNAKITTNGTATTTNSLPFSTGTASATGTSNSTTISDTSSTSAPSNTVTGPAPTPTTFNSGAVVHGGIWGVAGAMAAVALAL